MLRKIRWTLLLTLGLGLLAACGAEAPEGGAPAENQAFISSNQTGRDGGYYYSFWTNGQGSANMTLDGSNGYSVQWSNVGDFTAGKGWNPGSSHTISFSGSYTHSGGGGFGIYGWTKNPLIEYYIVEKSGNGGSPGQGTQVGTMTSDGSTYTVWKHQQVNQPCITGNTCTFWQYISVRQSQRTSGTITIANHFNDWAQRGMNLGTHDYQILLTEGWNGSGSSSGKVSEGGSSSGGTSSGGTSSGGTSTCAVSNGSIKIAAGSSSAVSGFCADSFYSGGSTYNSTNTVDASQASGAPSSLFNNERYGASTYTIPGFTAGSTYTVTLYFAETYVTSAGSRVFNVSINNSQVLNNFDIYSSAGGQNKGIAKAFTTTANGQGQIVIALSNVTENAKINGIAIAPGGGSTSGGSTSGGGTTNGSAYINAGGSAAAGSYGADQFYSGGSTYTNSNTIDTSALTASDAPPAAAFQSERYGAMTYTIPGLTAGASYNVTLYFAETYVTSAGSRTFNVAVNGAGVLSNFDIYAAAGGQNKAVARSFTATASSSGQIAIQFSAVTENPKVNAISVVPGNGGSTSGGSTSGGSTAPGVGIAVGSSSAVGSFTADQYYSGGSTYNNTNTVSTSGITTNVPPAALFNNERYGAFTYTIPNLTAGAPYTVTLYFAETYLTSSGSRTFNVSVNGSSVLCGFDIYAAAGGQNKAIARAINTSANSAGQIVIQLSAVTENPKLNGILVTTGNTGSSTTCTAGNNGGGNNGGGTTNCSGYVGISFDDGPGSNTTALINALKSAGLTPVTFFNIGQNVAANPSLVQQELAVGSVQNHSYTHQHMTTMSQSAVLDEINRTNQAIQNAGAPKPTLIRWPYGEHNGTTDAAASQAGVYGMTWDVDSQDWNGASTSSIVSAANRLTNGQVILMHDAYPNTTNQAISQIAANLKAKGLCPGKIVNGRAVAP